MSDPIADAIAAAKAQAAAPVAPATSTASVPATTPAAGPAAPLSATSMMQGSFTVDAFLKVTEDGIKVGESSLIETLKVSVDLNEAYYYYAIKFGNPAVYKKTLDRVRSLDGKAWQDCLAEASRVDGNKFKGEYRSADIPMVLLEPAVDIKGKEVAPKGHRVGKSLSTTEWREWETLLRTVQKRGVNVENGVIEMKVTAKKRNNAAGNVWGVLVFEFLGEAALEQAA